MRNSMSVFIYLPWLSGGTHKSPNKRREDLISARLPDSESPSVFSLQSLYNRRYLVKQQRKRCPRDIAKYF